jgi:hypothetical protein
MVKVRNITQTYMERDIIKTAPDMVVYINDLPYVRNPYVGPEGTAVNFNDFITEISGSCDTDALIPTSNIVMSVPNHYQHLFMAPGGNKILATMSIIKMFSKGYYFDKDGNTVYHRVFYGLIDSIGYSYTGTTLQITMNCKGIMRLFELIQTNVSPSTLNQGVLNGKTSVTAFRTKDYEKSSLAIIYKNIFEELDANDIASAMNETNVQNANKPNALDTRTTTTSLLTQIKERYIKKWEPVLSEIRQATRLYGWDYTKDPKTIHNVDPVSQAATIKSFWENQTVKVSTFLPDYAIGNIQLLSSKITSKLERISTMAGVTGYESYQDLNGNVIFKPPLYNLDVTDSKTIDQASNPFIINLDEITDEHEQEDEQAIRATRIIVKGCPYGAMLDAPTDIVPGITAFTDINLFSKFGMREAPVKEISWLQGDELINYGYAVAELCKMNRTYRTYRFSIPMRPEIKLGFPCYIKHHDMYGYIRNISWHYSVGGTSTMSITLDSMRRRVLLPFDVTNPDTGVKTTEFKSVPNLVYKFSKNPNDQPPKAEDKDKKSTAAETDPQGTKGAVGAPSPPPLDQAEVAFNKIHDDYMDSITSQTRFPKKGEAWIITKDNTGNTDGVFSEDKPCDNNYILALRDTQPYTDSKGYELYGPFPWGRWVKLEDAINLFTLSLKEQRNNNKETVIDSDSLASSMIFMAETNPDVAKLSAEMKAKYKEAEDKLNTTSNVTKFILNASKYMPEDKLGGPSSLNPSTPAAPQYTATNTFIKPDLS